MDSSIFFNDINPTDIWYDIFIDIIEIVGDCDSNNVIIKTLRDYSFFSIDDNISSLSLIEVDRAIAVRIGEDTLSKSLAYYPMNHINFDEEKTKDICTKFFFNFREGTRYYTNSSWNQNEYTNNQRKFGFSGWHSLTQATFDTGIIALDDKKIGILWVQEED